MSSIRRLVTGLNSRGKSILVADGPAECIARPLSSVPELALINLWSTQESPTEISFQHDAATKVTGLLPSAGGSIFRMVDFPPESTYLNQVSSTLREEAFANMKAEDCADHDQHAHPFMHRTSTVDYVLVLEGEIYLVLDQSEHLMQAGDVAVQCATNHAWSNRSNKNCRMAFILLDAKEE